MAATAHSLAVADIKSDLEKEGKTMIAFGTFVRNVEVRDLVDKFLTQQRKSVILSMWAKKD